MKITKPGLVKLISKFALLLIFFISAIPASATTVSDVLAGIKNARAPESLMSLTFLGDMRMSLTSGDGLLPAQSSILGAWQSPDLWISTYELSGELASGMSGIGSGHPAVDQVFLSRPDFLNILDTAWTAQYQGSATWDGEPAWQLLFTTRDITLDTPPFTLYVRKDDFVPLRASVTFQEGSTAITDMTWIVDENVLLPAKFTTTFNPPVGPLAGYETTWFNHEINPDLSDIDFPREQGALLSNNDPDNSDEAAVFEELYHGFADNPINAPLTDSSGTYGSIEFTFSLYVEDASIPAQLDSRQTEIRNLAIQVISGWDWSGDNGLSTPGGKYECGMEIKDRIGELLGTDSITDFYFLDFVPSA
jgi:flagellar basal body-associated protein FliL